MIFVVFIFALASLATFRLALMLSSEKGPMRIFARFRRLPPPKSNAREGLSCEWCMSVYVSAAVTTYVSCIGYLPGKLWPLYWLAVSASAVALNQILIASKK